MPIDAEDGHPGHEPPYPGLLLACTLELESLHPDVAAHGRVVASHAGMVAADLGMGGSELIDLKTAAMLHDIGKIAIPRGLLDKPAALDAREWDVMRTHPAIGAWIVHLAGLGELAGWILAHHERPDGRGYPRGLRGSEISLEARVIAVTDAYDAMTSDRPYRRSLTHEEAIEELLSGAGTQFDPGVVDVFTAAVNELIEGTVPSLSG